MEQNKYIPKPEKQLRSWFNEKVRKGRIEFQSYQGFKDWYDSKEKVCHYCGISELESQLIVGLGILTSNRFPLHGILTRGRCRGYWLEIDRIQPKGNYSTDNSVLCCYFCNNDKSDVFTGEDYKHFMKDRVGFLRKKLDISL
jgi:hypothetical protein